MSYVYESVAALVLLLFTLDLNGLETCGVALAAWLAAQHPRLGRRQFEQAEQWFGRLARRRGAAVVFTGGMALLLRLALLPVAPLPQPGVVDEYSHRLLAETLAAGRASNPAHPMWSHFETMQVIQKPTYASMYLPGQALFLLLGKVVSGCMWAGVVLSVVLMSMAICWALQGWLPPGWALFGGMIAVFRFGLFSYWINSYWGGAAGALGGALVIGAFPRIVRGSGTVKLVAAVLMALGVSLLAVTRPFEGAMVCLPVAAAMLIWLAGLPRSEKLPACALVAAPIACILAVAAAMLGSYNLRVTGAATRLPYAINQQVYGWPLTLPWFAVEPHTHRSKEMHDYFLWETQEHAKITDLRHHVFANFLDAFRLWTFFAGPVLTVFFVFLPRSLMDRRVRLATWVLAAGVVAVGIEQSRFPHYFAPATAAVLILMMQSARHMRAVGMRRRPGLLAMVRLLPVVLLVMVGARAAVPALRSRDTSLYHYTSWCCGRPGNLHRAELVDRLQRTEGKHLVIVRYGANHQFFYEWVYNDPDIDRSRIVWARDLGEDANRELLRYFADRRVWFLVLDDDQTPGELSPYSIRTP